MRRAYPTLVALWLGCSGDQPETRHLGEVTNRDQYYRELCVRFMATRSWWEDRSLPGAFDHHEAFVCFVPGVDGASRVSPVTLEWRTTGGFFGKICSIRLGPSRIYAPLDPERFVALIPNPFIAADVRALAAQVDARRQYHLSATVHGVHVRFDQRDVPGFGVYLELEVNGCNRVEDDTVEISVEEQVFRE